MGLDKEVFEIYTKKLPEKYEKMQKYMVKYKEIAAERSKMKPGD